jgi:hypothetical protein
MKNETRSELLDALRKLSEARPDWRLGQTMANLAMAAGRLDAAGVWDLEDEEALAAARVLIEQQSELGLASETGNRKQTII